MRKLMNIFVHNGTINWDLLRKMFEKIMIVL